MSCTLRRSNYLPLPAAWNRIPSLPLVGLLCFLQVLLVADFECTLNAAAATCAPTVYLLLLLIPFCLCSPHIFDPAMGCRLVYLFST